MSGEARRPARQELGPDWFCQDQMSIDDLLGTPSDRPTESQSPSQTREKEAP